MKKQTIRIIGLLYLYFFSLISNASCENNSKPAIPPANIPEIQALGDTVKNFIPPNWKKVESVTDDFNKDGLPDVALTIVDGDTKKIITKNECGSIEFDSNPYAIIVLFKQINGKYKLAAKDFNLIPRRVDDNIDQPYAGIQSKNGVLSVSYNYWQSMGSWTTVGYEYLFRFQQDCMKLIGLNYSTFHRASNEEGLWSTNFNTGQLIETHAFPDETPGNPAPKKPTESHRKIKQLEKMCLGKLPSEEFIGKLIFTDNQ